MWGSAPGPEFPPKGPGSWRVSVLPSQQAETQSKEPDIDLGEATSEREISLEPSPATDVSAARSNAILLERARIAGVIHEGVTQVLTNVAIQMEVFDKLLDDPEAARTMVRSLRTAVLDALDTLRGAILELTPNAPDWTDLRTGLERFSGDFAAQWGLDISFRVIGEVRDVEPETVALAFAFAQEALSNARKHSGANRIWVEVSFSSDSVRVEIGDDGKGFDPDTGVDDSFRRHQGLQILRSRVRLEGARFEVRSSPGNGTVAVLETRDPRSFI